MTIVRISDDALARACGADDLAKAFADAGCEVHRVSSWGMFWLEPLVEIDGAGFGPATPEDVETILAGTFEKSVGRIADHPFIKNQQRLTFTRAGRTRPLSNEDYEATGGWIGLKRARAIGAEKVLEEVIQSGSSLPDQSVLDVQIEHLRREATMGGYEAAAAVTADDAAVYDSIAMLIGAQRSEIARMEHATAAWNTAFWAIPKRAGQRIITHDHDYGANWIAFLRAVEVDGVTIERIPSDANGQIDLEQLAIALERPEDVALVSLAWIPTSGGLVNPAAAVGELTRGAGVPFLLDACQAIGQLDIDVDAIGCDALSATGRKYLRGPRGTGFLFVRSDAVDRFVPAQPDHHGAEWVAMDRYEFVPGAQRYEYWEYSHASWLGLGAAVDVSLELGVDRIQTTVAQRARQLRHQLTDASMTVHDEGLAKCGIVTMSHPRLDASDVVAGLRARGVNASSTFAGSARADMEARGLPAMVRLSVHCTTTTDELDRAVEILAAL